MPENTSYLDTKHPVRQLLTAATFGSRPTVAQLDALRRSDVPEGADLHRFRGQIASAVDEIITAHGSEASDSGGRSSHHADALRVADDHIGRLARQMTPAERAVAGDEHPASLDDLASRMFGGN